METNTPPEVSENSAGKVIVINSDDVAIAQMFMIGAQSLGIRFAKSEQKEGKVCMLYNEGSVSRSCLDILKSMGRAIGVLMNEEGQDAIASAEEVLKQTKK